MPRAPKPCGHSGCPTKVRGRTYCDEHQPVAWNGGYGSTRAWRKLREQVLQEEPFCRECGDPSTEAGHIKPRIYGGRDVRENVMGICHQCNLDQIEIDRKPQGTS